MTYDLVILGGGPAGYVGAIRAAQLGLRTALIEKEQVGGTCLNWGCIPTKSLYASAALFEKLKHADEYGIRLAGVELDFGRVMSRKTQIREKLVNGVRQLLQANKIDVFAGKGRLTGPRSIRVNGIELKGEHLLLATGSQTAPLPIPGIGLQGVFDSRSILDIDKLPQTLTIIGGGVIGIEFASIFAAFGTKVTVIEMADSLLTGLDSEIVKKMSTFMKQKGMTVHTRTKVLSIEEYRSPDRADSLQLSVRMFGPDGVETSVTADCVLTASGRVPDFGGIDLEKWGIGHDPRKGIAVDAHMRTNVNSIYAAGDVTGGALLAHVASHEALIAVHDIAARKTESPTVETDESYVVPACIFSLPEIASVGLTEDQARDQVGAEGGLKISRFPFAASGKALSEGDKDGFVKLIARKKDGVIVGAHIIGAHASEMIQEATLAVQKGWRASELALIIHPHPTLSESIAEASLGIDGLMLHYVNR